MFQLSRRLMASVVLVLACADRAHSLQPGRRLDHSARVGQRYASTKSDLKSPSQYEEELQALRTQNKELSAQLQATQQLMAKSLVEQHESRLHIAKEAEQERKLVEQQLKSARSRVDEYATAMSESLVKQHEAKLQMVEAVEAPLKASLKAEKATVASLKQELRGMAALAKNQIIDLAYTHRATVAKLNEEIEALGQDVQLKIGQLDEYRHALQDYMTTSHESHLANLQATRAEAMEEGARKRSSSSSSSYNSRLKTLEKRRADNENNQAATIASLTQELEDIKQLRDDYIQEREQELEALGDA